MAGNDVYLRGVPSDANPNDVRLYDPTVADTPAVDDGYCPPPAIFDTWQPDEGVDPGYLASFEVVLCGPLEDTAVVADDTLHAPAIFDPYGDEIAAREAELEPPFWAIPPPDDGDPCHFPAIFDIVTGGDTASVTSHVVTLPTNIKAGQRLIILVGDSSVGFPTFPAGWTRFFAATNGSSAMLAGVYRDCDGTEGATVTYTTSGSIADGWIVYRLQAGTFSTAAPTAGTTSGSSTTPNSPSFAGGTDKQLWITAFGAGAIPARTVTAYPTGYDAGQAYGAASTGGGNDGYVGAACKTGTTTPEDPPAFTISVSDNWVAATINQTGPCYVDDVPQIAVFDAETQPEEGAEFFALGPLDEPSADDTLFAPVMFDADVGEEDQAEPFTLAPLDDAAAIVSPPPPADPGGGPMHWTRRPSTERPKPTWPNLPKVTFYTPVPAHKVDVRAPIKAKALKAVKVRRHRNVIDPRLIDRLIDDAVSRAVTEELIDEEVARIVKRLIEEG